MPEEDLPPKVDRVVIGGGIVGLATARELLLRRPGSTVVVLERETDVGSHQTSHNTGVIHAGIYYPPGSRKAELCRRGADELYEYCAEKHIPARASGKLIVALRSSELPGLDELERRATQNQVPGLRRVSAAELTEYEPEVTGIAGLHSPRTGVVDFHAVAQAYAEDIRAFGGLVLTGVSADGISESVNGATIDLGTSQLRTDLVYVCAGAWSDQVARSGGQGPDPQILPFRGNWLKLVPQRRNLVRSMIYPVSDPALPFLGVHFTRTVADEVLIGPTALLVGARDAYRLRRVNPKELWATATWPGTYRMARRWWRTGLREIRQAASPAQLVRDAARYIPALVEADVVAGPSGIRSQAVGRDGALLDDFVITRTAHALYCRNVPSPAATASLALSRAIVDLGETKS